MAGVSGLLTTLIMVGVVLYVGVNFVLPLAERAVGDVKGIAGLAAYDYGQEF
jgi:hypothetical protein